MKKKRPSPPKLTYSVREAGQALGLGKTFIYDLINTGKLTAVKVGGRRLITAESVHSLINPGMAA